ESRATARDTRRRVPPSAGEHVPTRAQHARCAAFVKTSRSSRVRRHRSVAVHETAPPRETGPTCRDVVNRSVSSITSRPLVGITSRSDPGVGFYPREFARYAICLPALRLCNLSKAESNFFKEGGGRMLQHVYRWGGGRSYVRAARIADPERSTARALA